MRVKKRTRKGRIAALFLAVLLALQGVPVMAAGTAEGTDITGEDLKYSENNGETEEVSESRGGGWKLLHNHPVIQPPLPPL